MKGSLGDSVSGKGVALKAPEARPLCRILYVSYDGILEPLGESQVVAYLEGLSTSSRLTLLSFEKDADRRDRTRMRAIWARLNARGIEWIPLAYHKWPPVLSTAYDVLKGIAIATWLALPRRFGLVHARGYVPSLVALALKRLTGAKFLFDMRGLWADEKVDGGHWTRTSRIYRTTKRFERQFFESADGIVSLTHAGIAAISSLGYDIRKGVPIDVITTCTDLDRFTPGAKDPGLVAQLGLSGCVVIGCMGTMSNWYLRQPMLDGLAILCRALAPAKVLMVTRENHDALRSDAIEAGIEPGRLVLASAPFAAMPEYVRLMDIGLFFIKGCFSKKGSAATKLGEFLATGVPVVINDGIGDSGAIVREHGVGVVLKTADQAEVSAAVGDIQALVGSDAIRRRCRETAERAFSLEEGIRRYQALYDTLVKEEAA